MISAAKAYKDAMNTNADCFFVRQNCSYISKRIRKCKDFGMVKTKYRIREDDSLAPLRRTNSYQRIIEKLKKKGYEVSIQCEKYGYRFSDDYDKITSMFDYVTKYDDNYRFNGTYLYISWDKRKESD